MGLPADGDAGAHVGVLPMAEQELVPAHQDLPHPLEDVRVVEDLVLDELLGHGEEDLAGDVPEGVDWRFRVPQLDLVRLMQFTQRIHRFLNVLNKIKIFFRFFIEKKNLDRSSNRFELNCTIPGNIFDDFSWDMDGDNLTLDSNINNI